MTAQEIAPAIVAYDLDESVAGQLMAAFISLPGERWSRSLVVGEDEAHPSRTSQHLSLAGDDLRGPRLQVRAILDSATPRTSTRGGTPTASCRP